LSFASIVFAESSLPALHFQLLTASPTRHFPVRNTNGEQPAETHSWFLFAARFYLITDH
jgi:hypothetical protein